MGKRPSILIIDTSPEPEIPTYDNLDEYGRQVLADEPAQSNKSQELVLRCGESTYAP
jgi:hypothetical protein